MASKYILKKTSNGEFMFNLTAENGQTVLTSERYSSKAGAAAGITAVRQNSPYDVRYERRTSVRREPYFVLKAANGLIIGMSEMYGSSTAMENGITAVKRVGSSALVDDQTLGRMFSY
jgi:uncharacterized protein YegP (UPF0339 family)